MFIFLCFWEVSVVVHCICSGDGSFMFKKFQEQIQMNSKVGNMARRRPDFESGVIGSEIANNERFRGVCGFKSGGCPTLPETNF